MSKKFRILFFFVLLLILLGTCSIGYGATFSQATIKPGITNLDIFNALCQQYNIDLTFTGSALTNYNNFLSQVNNSLCAFEVFNYNATTSSSGTTNRNDIMVWLFSPTSGVTSNVTTGTTATDIYAYNTGAFTQYYSYYYYYNNPKRGFITNSYTNKSSQRIFGNNAPTSGAREKYCLIFGQDGTTYYQRSADNDFDVSTLSAFKYHNSWAGTIAIRYDNTPHDFYKVTKNRSTEKWWQLGYIQGYEDYLITGYLGQYVDYDIIDDTFARADYLSENNIQNGNTLAFVIEGDKLKVYVNQYNIQYNRCYRLQIAYRQNSNDESDYINIPYYFTPYGDTSTSGEFIPITTDLDLDWIRTWEAQTNFDDITAGVIGQISPFDINYSGDFISGDFFGIKYTNKDEWGFSDLIFWFFDNLYGILTSFDNVSINFGILGLISSASFIIDNSIVATFVGLFTNSFIIIMCIFWYYRLIHAISTLNLQQISGYDIDNMFDLF